MVGSSWRPLHLTLCDRVIWTLVLNYNSQYRTVVSQYHSQQFWCILYLHVHVVHNLSIYLYSPLGISPSPFAVNAVCKTEALTQGTKTHTFILLLTTCKCFTMLLFGPTCSRHALHILSGFEDTRWQINIDIHVMYIVDYKPHRLVLYAPQLVDQY